MALAHSHWLADCKEEVIEELFYSRNKQLMCAGETVDVEKDDRMRRKLAKIAKPCEPQPVSLDDDYVFAQAWLTEQHFKLSFNSGGVIDVESDGEEAGGAGCAADAEDWELIEELFGSEVEEAPHIQADEKAEAEEELLGHGCGMESD